MSSKFYFRGTKISLVDTFSEKKINKSYLLAEVNDEKFVFQIICLTGYDSGRIIGYVTKDPIADEQMISGVTKTHLINEISRNVIYEKGSLSVTDE